MTDRYGDFVLYRPPFVPRTWLLWLAPVLLLAGRRVHRHAGSSVHRARAGAGRRRRFRHSNGSHVIAFVVVAGADGPGRAGGRAVAACSRGATPQPWPAVAGGGAAPCLRSRSCSVSAWSNWSWNATPASERRCRRSRSCSRASRRGCSANPTDIDGWLLLGPLHTSSSQRTSSPPTPISRPTRSRDGKNVEAVLGLGEALVFADERMLTGRSAQLFERAYERAPHHPKALWYSGLAAYQSGRLDVARERWASWSRSSRRPKSNECSKPRSQRSTHRAADSAAVRRTAAPATSARASSRCALRVDARAGGSVPQDAPLFVHGARGEGGGPPLAVTRRSSAQLPLLVRTHRSRRDDRGPRPRRCGRASRWWRALRAPENPRAQSGDLEGQVGYDVSNRETGRSGDQLHRSLSTATSLHERTGVDEFCVAAFCVVAYPKMLLSRRPTLVPKGREVPTDRSAHGAPRGPAPASRRLSPRVRVRGRRQAALDLIRT